MEHRFDAPGTPENMNRISKMFAGKIFDAMQDCEEIGGPVEGEYMDVMDAVIAECQHRKAVYAEILKAKSR